MRIWDVTPKILCRQHLLGEHRELHALWTILTEGKQGYRKHPETLRWEGKLAALFRRHELLVEEICSRGYQHHSPLDISLATGASQQDSFVNSIDEQKVLLKKKGCTCNV